MKLFTLQPGAKGRRFVVLVFALLSIPAPLGAGGFSLEPGDILVANHASDSVLKVEAATGAVRSLGSWTAPTDIALAPNGVLYIAEWGGLIHELNLNDGGVRIINPATAMSSVWGLVLGPSGKLIVTCGADDSVVEVDPNTGDERLISATNSLWGVAGIDLLDATHVVVCSTFNNQVVKVSLEDGTQTPVPTVGGGIDRPRGITVSGNTLFVTALDSSEIRSLSASGGTVSTFYTATSSLFGMGINTNGEIIAGADKPPFEILRIDAAGSIQQTYSHASFSEMTGLEVSRMSFIVTNLPNSAPLLDPIEDIQIDHGTLISFFATAADTDWPPQNLTFSLGAGAPAGATISSDGVFSWRPSADQPGVHVLAVVVSDDASPPMRSTNTFTVTVNSLNSRPSIPNLLPMSVYEGDLLSVQLRGEDADLPAQALNFTLLPGAPNGVAISASNVLTWLPQDADGPTNILISFMVTDNGTPPLSATNSLSVTVHELYLQCSGSPIGPYHDEPAALFEKSSRMLSVSNSVSTNCFYRLRCDLPVRITSLRLIGSESIIQYQLE